MLVKMEQSPSCLPPPPPPPPQSLFSSSIVPEFQVPLPRQVVRSSFVKATRIQNQRFHPFNNSNQSVQSSQSVQLNRPNQSNQSVQLIRPNQSSQSVQLNRPNQSNQSNQSNRSVRSSGSARSNRPSEDDRKKIIDLARKFQDQLNGNLSSEEKKAFDALEEYKIQHLELWNGSSCPGCGFKSISKTWIPSGFLVHFRNSVCLKYSGGFSPEQKVMHDKVKRECGDLYPYAMPAYLLFQYGHFGINRFQHAGIAIPVVPAAIPAIPVVPAAIPAIPVVPAAIPAIPVVPAAIPAIPAIPDVPDVVPAVVPMNSRMSDDTDDESNNGDETESDSEDEDEVVAPIQDPVDVVASVQVSNHQSKGQIKNQALKEIREVGDQLSYLTEQSVSVNRQLVRLTERLNVLQTLIINL